MRRKDIVGKANKRRSQTSKQDQNKDRILTLRSNNEERRGAGRRAVRESQIVEREAAEQSHQRPSQVAICK